MIFDTNSFHPKEYNLTRRFQENTLCGLHLTITHKIIVSTVWFVIALAALFGSMWITGIVFKKEVLGDNYDLIMSMLSKYPDIQIEIFNLHRLGQSKYESLGMEYEFVLTDKEEIELQKFYKQLTDKGFKVKINKV